MKGLNSYPWHLDMLSERNEASSNRSLFFFFFFFFYISVILLVVCLSHKRWLVRLSFGKGVFCTVLLKKRKK